MKKLLFFTISIHLFSISISFSQNCPPVGPDGDTIQAVICDCGVGILDTFHSDAYLDGYCFRMGYDQSACFDIEESTVTLCNGLGIFNNPHFFALTPSTSTLKLLFTPSNCANEILQPALVGIQVGIYDTCFYYAYNPIVCQGACQEEPFILESNDFIPGKTYFLAIDGCGVDMCDVVIELLEGSIQSNNSNNPVTQIGGPVQCCEQTLTEFYAISAPEGAPYYQWSINGVIQNESSYSLLASFPTNGNYQLCVQSFTQDSVPIGLPICKDIVVSDAKPLQFTLPNFTICEDSSFNFKGQWIDGANGSKEYTITVPTNGTGCDSLFTFEVNVCAGPWNDLGKTFICLGDTFLFHQNPITDCGIYFVPIYLNTPPYCKGKEIVEVQTINIDAEIVAPDSIQVQPGQLLLEASNVTVEICNTPASQSNLNYIWSLDGKVYPGKNTSTIAVAKKPGNYCVQITYQSPMNTLICPKTVCKNVYVKTAVDPLSEFNFQLSTLMIHDSRSVKLHEFLLNANMHLYSIDGRKLKEWKNESGEWSCDDLSNGLYYCLYQLENGSILYQQVLKI